MLQPEATLIAAFIAAIASLLSLATNILFARQGEQRSTHRTILLPFLSDLSESLEEICLLCSRYVEMSKAGNIDPDWHRRIVDASQRLDLVRKKVKYPLWGLDSGLRILVYVPDWMKMWADNIESAQRLLTDISTIRYLLDESIRQSYKDGHPPNRWQILKLEFYASRINRTWGISLERSKVSQ